MITKKRTLQIGTILIFTFLITVSIAGAIPFAYITNSGDNTVSVVDTATNSVIKSINVGNEPYGVAVSPDGKKVYVANSGSNNISVIDTTTNVVTSNVPVGDKPEGVAVNPAGTKVYVANSGGPGIPSIPGTISVIDTATNNVTTVNVGGINPLGIVVSPDGNNVYVACYGNNAVIDDKVSIIDTATNTVIDNVRVGVHPQGIAVSPDGKKVYVTCENPNTYNFYIIDTATNNVTGMYVNGTTGGGAYVMPVGHNPYGVAVNPTGTKVYITSPYYGYDDFSGTNYLFEYDTTSNNFVAPIKLRGLSSGGVSVNPDGTKVYAVASDINTVFAVNTTTKNVTTVSVGKNPISLGQFIVPPEQLALPVANFSCNVTQGYAPLSVQFTDLSKDETNRKWDFGDGITSTEYNPIHTYSVAGNYEVTLIVTNGVGQSTKESRIDAKDKDIDNPIGPYAYISNQLDNTVSVIDTATAKVINTLKVGNLPYGVAVSSDGNKVYVVNSDKLLIGQNKISVIDTTTNNVTNLSLHNSNFEELHGIAVSPDGKMLYVSDYGAAKLYLYDLTTNNFKPVSVGSNPEGVAVSPDGKMIYVACSENYITTYSEVYVINTATKMVESIVNVAPKATGVAVSPDGKKVYVTCANNYAYNFYIIDTATNIKTGMYIDQTFNPNVYHNYATCAVGIAVNPTGTKVYIVSPYTGPRDFSGTNYLFEYDTTSNKFTSAIKLGGIAGYGVSVNPDGTKVYAVANDVNSVFVVNTTTKNVTAVTVGRGPIAFGQFIVPSIYSSNPVLPVANFTSNITFGYAPLTVQFTDLSTNAAGWAWNFGDGVTISGNNSSTKNPLHTYITAGNFIVNLTVSNANVTSSKTAAINVNLTPVLPVANFSSNVTQGYVPLTVQFNDSSKNATYVEWNFGDGNTSTEQNPTHTYSVAENYTVNLTASNENGTDSKLAKINVLANPVLPAFPGYSEPPTDPNHDDLYEDINGNKILDFDDVVAYYDNMDWIEGNTQVALFDSNKNGFIDFDDVVKLYDIV